jgi:uncharacterized protein (DUF433 family)
MTGYPLDSPGSHPHVSYRRGASGLLVPVVRGTGLRVQTIVIAHELWGWSPAQIATDCGISEKQVDDALAFYRRHRQEIDGATAEEQELEPVNRTDASGCGWKPSDGWSKHPG